VAFSPFKLPWGLVCWDMWSGIWMANVGELDYYAYRSGLRDWPWPEKLATAAALMALCQCKPLVWLHLVIAVSCFMLLWSVGRVPFRPLVGLFCLPMGFVVVGVALASFGQASSLIGPSLVLSRSLGCLSCLYLISLTTPLNKLLGIFCLVKVPRPIVLVALSMVALVNCAQISLREILTARLCRAGDRTFGVSVTSLGLALSALNRRLSHKTDRWLVSSQLRGGSQGLIQPPSWPAVRISFWLGFVALLGLCCGT
jgi:cobalt/nickel transport system permease protein